MMLQGGLVVDASSQDASAAYSPRPIRRAGETIRGHRGFWYSDSEAATLGRSYHPKAEEARRQTGSCSHSGGTGTVARDETGVFCEKRSLSLVGRSRWTPQPSFASPNGRGSCGRSGAVSLVLSATILRHGMGAETEPVANVPGEGHNTASTVDQIRTRFVNAYFGYKRAA